MENNMDELIRLQKKQLAQQRGILIIMILLIAGAFLVFLTARNEIRKEIAEVNAVLGTVNEKLSALDMDRLTQTVDSLKKATDTVSKVDVTKFNRAVDDFSEAADSITGLDMEALNKLVTSLESVTGVLAKLFGR